MHVHGSTPELHELPVRVGVGFIVAHVCTCRHSRARKHTRTLTRELPVKVGVGFVVAHSCARARTHVYGGSTPELRELAVVVGVRFVVAHVCTGTHARARKHTRT